MKPERWQQIKTLLQAALEREPDQRAAFLAEACADDESLRSDVESFIGSYEQAGDFIEAPAFELMADSLTNLQGASFIGQSFGPYKILEHLGAGGMGDVYLAEDERLGRKVAVKILPVGFTWDNERVRRFQQEARAASALNHPNILTIFEIGEIDSRHFIATEFIEGETLRQRMVKSHMEINEVLDVAVQVASALMAAHQAGIAHRDIKPENIMLRRDGFVKVVDFGVAKLTEPKTGETEAVTLLNTKQGTAITAGNRFARHFTDEKREWRSRHGVFQRRHHRKHHQRSLATTWAPGGGSFDSLPLQGFGSRPAGSRAAA